MRRRHACQLLLVLIAAISSRPVSAQAAATVSLSDPAYAAIDELQAALPNQGLLIGQRPYSRREVARIALRFNDVLSRAPDLAADVRERLAALVRSLLAAYAREVRSLNSPNTPASPLALSPAARLDLIGTNSAPRPVPPSNGLGDIVATTNPLTDGFSGRPVAHGTTTAAELALPVGIGSWIALEVDPRLTWLSDRTGTRQFDAELQRAYLRVVVRNVAVQAGADERVWGQGGPNGMLLSANPRPLHAVTIANDTPFTLPGFLGRLGPVRATFMGASLGDAQNFPGAQLYGYKIGIMPTPRLELGFGIIDQMGGTGAPRLGVGERIKDLFPYVFLAISPSSDRQASNKIASVDFRYHARWSRDLTVYYELDPDDFDVRRLGSIYWQDSGHLLGAHIDRLTADGRFALDAQFQRTSLRLYEHGEFTSGVTYRNAIIGDPLGPNALAGYTTLSARLPRSWTLSLSAALEARDSSIYTVIQSDTVTGRGWRFVKLADGVTEKRARMVVNLTNVAADRVVSFWPMVGVERVLNDGFALDRTATNVIAGVSLRIRF